MAYEEPYSAWFDGVVAALIDDDGPFTKAGQIELWVDQAPEELLPDERLVQALTRDQPHCLVAWTGGPADAVIAGGGNSHRELVEFVTRYSCGSPKGPDFAEALKADGTAYWGAWAVHDWIIQKIVQLEVDDFETPAELVGVSPVAIDKKGVLAFALRWHVHMLRSYAD